MNTENELKEYLDIWKGEYTKKIASGEIATSHIPEEIIYKMAEDNGMTNAVAENIEHLSFCPVCMEKWALWREAISVAAEDEKESPFLMSYGYLKAAATVEAREPVSSLSSCGRFRLNIEPPLEKEDKWLVIIEMVTDAETSLEGRNIEVRDRKGRVLLDGKIKQGRMARFWTTMEDFDLSNWTLIEKNEEES